MGNEDALAERDMVIHLLIKKQDEHEPFNLEEDKFTVLLIGKDGTEKGRWHEPVSVEELFTLIDTMPMRQREMKEAQ